jgi:hypothetical protein
MADALVDEPARVRSLSAPEDVALATAAALR